MKKSTKALLVSATVLLSLAPAAAFASDVTATPAQAEAISYDANGHWAGPSIDIRFNNAIQVKTGAGSYDWSKIGNDQITAVAPIDNSTFGTKSYGDTTLYTDQQSAVLQDSKNAVKDPSATAGKTYYQRVYVQVEGLDTNEALLTMKIGYSPARVTFNGAGMNYANYANGKGSFVIVRAVTISDNPTNTNNSYYNINTNGTVKVTKQDGVATLYTANGEKITGRALAPNTNWYTDIQRIKSDGQVFYRVSTNEYVAEKDVDFLPASAATNN